MCVLEVIACWCHGNRHRCEACLTVQAKAAGPLAGLIAMGCCHLNYMVYNIKLPIDEVACHIMLPCSCCGPAGRRSCLVRPLQVGIKVRRAAHSLWQSSCSRACRLDCRHALLLSCSDRQGG